MIIINTDWDIIVVGKKNPFRYYKVTRLFKPLTEMVYPTGGDDSITIQGAIDRLAIAEPKLVKVKLERKWKWPWQYPSGLMEITIKQTGTVKFSAGDFIIRNPPLVITSCILEGERT